MPPKSLLGLPWRYALACMDELGLILRRDIIWSKPNGLPESVTDRCRSSHEYLFHFTVRRRGITRPSTRSANRTATGAVPVDMGRAQGTQGNLPRRGRADATRRSLAYNPLGKLPGSVWSIPSQPLTVPAHLGVDHFAAFPMELPRRVHPGLVPAGCVHRVRRGPPPGRGPRRTR